MGTVKMVVFLATEGDYINPTRGLSGLSFLAHQGVKVIWFILGFTLGFLFCTLGIPSLIEYRARAKIPTEYRGKKYVITEEKNR